MIYLCWKDDGGGVARFVAEANSTVHNFNAHHLDKFNNYRLKHLRRLADVGKLPKKEIYVTQGPLIYLYCRLNGIKKVFCHVHNRKEYDSFSAKIALVLCKLFGCKFIYASYNLRKREGGSENDVVLLPILSVPKVPKQAQKKDGAYVSARVHPEKRLLELAQCWERITKECHLRHKLTIMTNNIDIFGDLTKYSNVNVRIFNEIENWHYMKSSAVYISSSIYEAFGLSMVDALVSGTPIVLATESGEFYDIFKANIPSDSFSGSTLEKLIYAAFNVMNDQVLRENLADQQLLAIQKRISSSRFEWNTFITNFDHTGF